MNEFRMLMGFENLDKVDEILGKNIFHFVTNPAGIAMLFIFKTSVVNSSESGSALFLGKKRQKRPHNIFKKAPQFWSKAPHF